jgi:hypothetical protein
MGSHRKEYSPLVEYWAALQIGTEWRTYDKPTIGELRSLRNKGAIVLHLVTERHGNQIDRTWVSDAGHPVIVSTRFLTRKEQEK